MMRNSSSHWRASSAAWLVVVAALAVAYITMIAGLVGFVSARTVSLMTFSGALVGCLAAAAYLITALQDVQRGAHR